MKIKISPEYIAWAFSFSPELAGISEEDKQKALEEHVNEVLANHKASWENLSIDDFVE